MLKEDRELGLNTEPEPEEFEESSAIPTRDNFEGEEDISVDDAVVDNSDTESIEAALAEFAINELKKDVTAAEGVESSTPNNKPRDATGEDEETDKRQDAVSNDEQDEGEDAQKASESAEPQLTKRDKRRAREAKKKMDAETAASNPATEVSST